MILSDLRNVINKKLDKISFHGHFKLTNTGSFLAEICMYHKDNCLD